MTSHSIICIASRLGIALLGILFTASTMVAQTSRTANLTEEESTTIGGYGEVQYVDPEGSGKGIVDVPRFILFLEHYFSPQVSFFSELEIEHVKIEGGEEGGEVALEQAYLQYTIDERFNVRAGLMVLPIGIVNEYHEPPTFNGVQRPKFDRFFIPTTWREIGVGFTGRIPEVDGMQYRAYITTGLDASGFNGTNTIRGGRTGGAQVEVNSLAFSGRLEYIAEGLRTGGWIYYGGSSNGDPMLDNSLFDLPVLMAGIDAQYNIENLYLRGVLATMSISDADKINMAYRSTPVLDSADNIIDYIYNNPVGSAAGGGYVEAAYDVLKLMNETTSHQLLPFVRFESFNTHASVPDGITENLANDRTYIVTGVTYKPTYNSVYKIDWTSASNGTDATVPGEFSLGVGYNF